MEDIIICPVCGNTKLENFYSNCQDHTVSHETFKLIKCIACGLVITSPKPNDESLGNYYLSDDYISHSNKAKSIVDKLYILIRRYTLKQKLKLIAKHNQTGLILDYGCGTGDFINVCKSNGWSTIGIEPSIDARQKALSLTKTKIYSSVEDLPKTRIDVITLWHVLEHIPDLENILKKLSDHLSENGTIFIAVPNHKSYDAEIYRELWAGYDVPRHLWHFCPSSMEKLLTNNSLKLKMIVPMRLDSFYVSLLSEKYKHDNKYSIKGFLKAISTGIKSNLKAAKTGNYSSLIYILQK